MKRKIGEIYNKPVVIGDKNLVTRNEIHESELNASTGGGDAPSGGDIIYIKWDQLDAIAMGLLASHPLALVACTIPETQTFEFVSASVLFAKIAQNDNTVYDLLFSIKGFSCTKAENVFIADKRFTIANFDDVINSWAYVGEKTIGSDASALKEDLYSSLSEITKEEFYNLEA